MFDGLVTGILIVGVLIGIALCGLAWLAWWVLSHLSVQWI